MRWIAIVVAGLVAFAACRDFGRFAAQPGATGGSAAGGDGGMGGMSADGGGGAATVGQGGGGTGGAGGAPPCGSMSLLATSFDSSFSSSFSSWTDYGTMDIDTVGGELVFTSSAPDAGAIASFFAYDMTGTTATIEITQPPGGGSKGMWFELTHQSDWAEFSIDGDTLSANIDIDGNRTVLASTSFDATAHRFLRFRESSGTLVWETSPDGAAWSELASALVTDLFDVRYAFIELGVQDDDGDAVVAVDNLNGGQPSGVYCSSEILVDDYDTQGTRPPAWALGEDSGCDAYSWDDELHLEMYAAQTGYCFRLASRLHDVRDSATEILARNTPPPGTGVRNALLFHDASDNGVGIVFVDDELQYATADASDIYPVSIGESFSSGWARLRIEGTSAYVDTSGDGIDWTEVYSSALPLTFDPSAVAITLGADTPFAPTEYVDTHFDKFNLPP